MITFLETDPEALLAQAVAAYEAVSGETLLPGDEHYQFLAQQVQLVVAGRESINDVANQNLLIYAEGDVLNEYGEQFDVSRMQAATASVMLRFSIPAALGFDVPIGKGVRVTPDGKLNFLTKTTTTIPAGQLSVTVAAVAEQAGSAYNAFLPGQIASIVDPVMYVSSVVNTTQSAGGSDQEDDASYRERIRQSWEGISTCGSKESYEYWAKSASADIADVEAVRSGDGEITLYVLMDGAAEPSQDLLDKVSAATTADKRRPLTDHVLVQAAQTQTYNINLTYYIRQSRSTEVTAIQNAVGQIVNMFAAQRLGYLGGQINPDTLRGAMLDAGAYRVDFTEPIYTELEDYEVAVCETVTVTYGGLL